MVVLQDLHVGAVDATSMDTCPVQILSFSVRSEQPVKSLLSNTRGGGGELILQLDQLVNSNDTALAGVAR
jgi:hypothetical protein